MDIGQMGGGDKLFAMIDRGIRAAKLIICCVTGKYAESPNCNREVRFATVHSARHVQQSRCHHVRKNILVRVRCSCCMVYTCTLGQVSLAVTLGKPIIPLLMEKSDWPPSGAMGPIFSEYIFVRFFARPGEGTDDERYWPAAKFNELLMQVRYTQPPDDAIIECGK